MSKVEKTVKRSILKIRKKNHLPGQHHYLDGHRANDAIDTIQFRASIKPGTWNIPEHEKIKIIFMKKIIIK